MVMMNKKEIIKSQFLFITGKEPNIDNPKTYNEKIQWLKLYYKNPMLTMCADKYRAREYVSKNISKEHLIPLLGIYKNEKEIDFKKLPNQFVIKTNNGSGKNIICKNKITLNIKNSKRMLKKWLQPNSSHYYHSFEWAYKNIKPKIICEKYLEQPDGNLYDYKFLCFNGVPKYVWVDIDRFNNHRRNIYDTKWRFIDVKIDCPNDKSVYISKPEKFTEMLQIAKRLSKNFPHVRVDLYYINKNIYFSELTFYSINGMARFNPESFNEKLGKLISIKNILRQQKKMYIDNKKHRKARIVIYTAISNNYDNLIQPTYISKNFDYICFTNKKIKFPGIWKIKLLKDISSDPTKNSRYYKINAHKFLKKYEYSIWIDSNINVITNKLENKILSLIKNKQILSINIHPERKCVYDEAKACIDQQKDDPEVILKEMNYLKKKKYPVNNGLYEDCIIYRRHGDSKITKLMNDWWYMVKNFSKRDQLSLNYVLWKNKIKCTQMFPINLRFMGNDFEFYDHNIKVVSTLSVDAKNIDGKNFIQKIISIANNQYLAKFNLQNFQNIKGFQLNILNNKYCQFKIDRITISNNHDRKFNINLDKIKYCSNIEKQNDNSVIFTTSMPKISINSKFKEAKSITIVGEIKIYKIEDKYKNELNQIKDSKFYKLWPLYSSLKTVFKK
jgi:hypothetical protein